MNDNILKNKEEKNTIYSKRTLLPAGFTLVETLVAISILVLLASIIGISTRVYIKNAKDAAIKDNMASLLTQGVIYFANKDLGNGYYTGFCLHNSVQPFISAINGLSSKSGTTKCNCNTGDSCAGSPLAWCTHAQLHKEGTVLVETITKGKKTKEKKIESVYYCVDSTGARKESTSTKCSDGRCKD